MEEYKMSKFLISLNYKDCCILKHKLRDSIGYLEQWIPEYQFHLDNKKECFTQKELEKLKRELEEEKRTLERLTEEIERNKENRHMKAR